jgi:hypothetical protein
MTLSAVPERAPDRRRGRAVRSSRTPSAPPTRTGAPVDPGHRSGLRVASWAFPLRRAVCGVGRMPRPGLSGQLEGSETSVRLNNSVGYACISDGRKRGSISQPPLGLLRVNAQVTSLRLEVGRTLLPIEGVRNSEANCVSAKPTGMSATRAANDPGALAGLKRSPDAGYRGRATPAAGRCAA